MSEKRRVEAEAAGSGASFWERIEALTEALYPGFAPAALADELQAQPLDDLQQLARRRYEDKPILPEADVYTRQEILLAQRNHGMHLEGLRCPLTPIGMHYLLVHFDIPLLKEEDYALEVRGLVHAPRPQPRAPGAPASPGPLKR